MSYLRDTLEKSYSRETLEKEYLRDTFRQYLLGNLSTCWPKRNTFGSPSATGACGELSTRTTCGILSQGGACAIPLKRSTFGVLSKKGYLRDTIDKPPPGSTLNEILSKSRSCEILTKKKHLRGKLEETDLRDIPKMEN